MSKKDLEAYWEARDAFTNKLKANLGTLTEPGLFREFLELKMSIDSQLRAKDQRAYRAVVLSAHVVSGEVAEILSEMFPGHEGEPPNARFLIMGECQKQICFELYRLLEKLVIDVANCLVPLKTEVQA